MYTEEHTMPYHTKQYLGQITLDLRRNWRLPNQILIVFFWIFISSAFERNFGIKIGPEVKPIAVECDQPQIAWEFEYKPMDHGLIQPNI